MRKRITPGAADAEGGVQWMPVADLMSGLMLVFLVLSVIFLQSVVNDEALADADCEQVYEALEGRFAEDFTRWDAEIGTDLTIRFGNPDTLFAAGSSAVTPRFGTIIEFVPGYIDVLRRSVDADHIEEIRIEGHTSSEWNQETTGSSAYVLNMELSQNRTREILVRALAAVPDGEAAEWMRTRTTANGLSSSRPVLGEDGGEDRERSRRVEFRILLDSCRRAGRYDG